MKTWWKWLYVSFMMMVTFTISQYKFMAWISQEQLSLVYLAGWILSFAVVTVLLIIRWYEDKNYEIMRKENERLREALEYFRNKSEHGN